MLHMFISLLIFYFFFFFTDTATTEIYTLSLHDALPISETSIDENQHLWSGVRRNGVRRVSRSRRSPGDRRGHRCRDRKSTRLNSSHRTISYAVFCLKKKKNQSDSIITRLLLVRAPGRLR